MPALAATDAHALIWAATGHERKLGTAARRMFRRAEAGKTVIYVPAIVVIEIGEAVHAGEVTFPIGFEAWITGLLSSGSFLYSDLTLEIILKSQELYGIPERGDRLVAATAMILDCPLITHDPEIAGLANLNLLW